MASSSRPASGGTDADGSSLLGGDESVVQATSPFVAEVRKPVGTRALVGGALLLVALIIALIVGSVLLKHYRERWTAERAEKEKMDKEKLATSRRGREFKLEERPAESLSAIPTAAGPQPATPAVPAGAASAPANRPSGPGAAAGPNKPMGPPMMMNASASQSGAASASDDQIKALAATAPSERFTVQAFAAKETAGKPPTTSSQAMAADLGDRSYLIARGSWIPCILETQLDTTVPGNTSCVIPEDVYSDDGKQLLIGKGSKAVGSFGNSLRRGDARIAVTWARVKTTTGVVIDVESPAADGVGTTGAGGYVDNHWLERVGAALLLSFVQDAVAYAVASAQRDDRQGSLAGGINGSGVSVYVPENTSSQTTRLAEKILDSTINIPPTLYKNRGDRLMIFVNRDLWFDRTYQLVRSN